MPWLPEIENTSVDAIHRVVVATHNLLVDMHNLAWDGELPLGVVGDIHNSAIANGACHCSYEIRQSTAFDYETNKISLSQNGSLFPN